MRNELQKMNCEIRRDENTDALNQLQLIRYEKRYGEALSVRSELSRWIMLQISVFLYKYNFVTPIHFRDENCVQVMMWIGLLDYACHR
jgi:hypothetical protein